MPVVRWSGDCAHAHTWSNTSAVCFQRPTIRFLGWPIGSVGVDVGCPCLICSLLNSRARVSLGSGRTFSNPQGPAFHRMSRCASTHLIRSSGGPLPHITAIFILIGPSSLCCTRFEGPPIVEFPMTCTCVGAEVGTGSW